MNEYGHALLCYRNFLWKALLSTSCFNLQKSLVNVIYKCYNFFIAFGFSKSCVFYNNVILKKKKPVAKGCCKESRRSHCKDC